MNTQTFTNAEDWIAAHGSHVCECHPCDKPGKHYVPNGMWPYEDEPYRSFAYATGTDEEKREKRRKACQRGGLATYHSRRKAKYEEARQALRREYEAGTSVEMLALREGVTERHMRSRLRDAGVEFPKVTPNGSVVKDNLRETVAALAKNGLGTLAIAKKLGHTERWIRRVKNSIANDQKAEVAKCQPGF